MFSRSIKADPDTFRREKDANVEMVSKTMSAIEQKCVKDIRNVAFFHFTCNIHDMIRLTFRFAFDIPFARVTFPLIMNLFLLSFQQSKQLTPVQAKGEFACRYVPQ